MEKNNSKMTPKGYNSYHLVTIKTDSGAKCQVNLLQKKSIWDRYGLILTVVIILFLLSLIQHIEVQVIQAPQ